jgi:glutaredoxin
MRATLVCGLLLLLLGVGVVQASRDAEGGRVAGWLRGEAEEPLPPPGPGDPAPAQPAAEPPAVLAAGEVSVLEKADPLTSMIRYHDDDGTLHLVRGMAAVPAEHRSDAELLGKGNINVVSMPSPTAGAFRDWEPEPNPNRSKVVLFSAPWCGACTRAKRHLDERGVVYRVRDIDADPGAKREVQRVLGRLAIPLLDVDGRYVSGFQPAVYDRALGRG